MCAYLFLSQKRPLLSKASRFPRHLHVRQRAEIKSIPDFCVAIPSVQSNMCFMVPLGFLFLFLALPSTISWVPLPHFNTKHDFESWRPLNRKPKLHRHYDEFSEIADTALQYGFINTCTHLRRILLKVTYWQWKHSYTRFLGNPGSGHQYPLWHS